MTTPAAPLAPNRGVTDLSYLLTHAAHVLATRMAAAFDEIDSTPRAFCVLMHAMSGEYTQIELAAMTDLDKTTMVVTLDELESAGYAERHPSPADRRARIVRVTETGRQAVATGAEVADRVHREVLEALRPGEGAAFVEALENLVGGVLAEPVDGARQVRRARGARRAAN
jgi:MarR family transcriptional regulator for hemolysin